jgi:hypothetical protein
MRDSLSLLLANSNVAKNVRVYGDIFFIHRERVGFSLPREKSELFNTMAFLLTKGVCILMFAERRVGISLMMLCVCT